MNVISVSLWIHIAAVVVAIGGSSFVLFVLRPALQTTGSQERERIMERVHARFRVIVWTCIGLITLTGLSAAGSLQVLKPEVLFGTTLYGPLLLVKILLAIILFACALLITLPSPSLARFRARAPQYLRMIVSIAVLIILIATSLRFVR